MNNLKRLRKCDREKPGGAGATAKERRRSMASATPRNFLKRRRQHHCGSSFRIGAAGGQCATVQSLARLPIGLQPALRLGAMPLPVRSKSVTPVVAWPVCRGAAQEDKMRRNVRWRSSCFVMSEVPRNSGAAQKKSLSVALFGSHQERRKAVAEALSARPGVRVREYEALPGSTEIPALAQQFAVLVLDVDSDPDQVLALAERLVDENRAYVMVFSANANMKLALRFMRAGVREFFTLPLDAGEIAAALTRAVEHRSAAAHAPEKTSGKVFVFLGTKGGCGVTTLASNFALALAQESEQPTLLVDFGLPLGDVAINLGMKAEYSVTTALQDADRLDANFLNTLVAKYESGLEVLAAPDQFPVPPFTQEAVDKLTAVALQHYEYVVVDAGSRIDLLGAPLFERAAITYLITQVGISELRNAHRMISYYFASRGQDLQIVLNRYTAKTLLFDDAQIAKTLTRPPQWKIPDDWASARRTRNTATPMVMVDSPLAETIREMARAAAGLTGDREGKRGLFRLLR